MWTIAEDARGLLYFGNLNQVLVFDGVRWTKLAVPGATFVRGLAVDRDDTLWIGGVDELGYAMTTATGERTFVSLKERLPPAARDFGAVWRVLATPGGVLFHTSSRLLHWNGSTFTVRDLSSRARSNMVEVGDEIWFTNNGAEWDRLSPGDTSVELKPLARPSGLQHTRVIGAAPSATAATIVIATENLGLGKWDGATFTALPRPTGALFEKDPIYGMVSLPDGGSVVHSLFHGLQRLDPSGQLQLTLNDENGLPNNTVICATPTRNGRALWLGTANGVVRMDLRPWVSQFNAHNGAPAAKLFAPVRVREKLYLPAAAAGLYRLEPTTGTAGAHLVREDSVDALVNSATLIDDVLMLGTTNGFREWDGATLYPRLPDSPTNASGFFALGKRPGWWAALDGDAVRLYQKRDGAWATAGPIPGLERVRSIVEDEDGSWWSGRPAGGVLHTRFPDDGNRPQVALLTAPDALPEGHGWTRFSRDAKGPLMACARGLFRFNARLGRFEPCVDYGAALADGSLSIRGLTPDDRGGFWFVVFENQSGEEEQASDIPHLIHSHAGHATTVRLPALAEIDDPSHLQHEPATPDGRPETLWIGAQDVLIRLNLDMWRAEAAEPKPRVLIQQISSTSGGRLSKQGGWALPHQDRSLRVRLASPDVAGDPAALFETRFLTSSGSIGRTDSQPDRDFTALASGHYTLSVRVRPTGGDWSEPEQLSFTVNPPWWWSPSALLVYIVASALAIVIIWQLRIDRLLQRQRELEAAIADRTAVLASQNAELERLRQIEFDEKLAARLAAEKASLEVLRYQLNPHFLFNTLNAICAQIIKSPRVARDTVIRLAEFCRLTLHRTDEQAAPTLAQEIGMLRAYLDIERTRMGPLLDVDIRSDPVLDPVRLPPFLLLPLVENAVKYGSATSDEVVRIRLRFSSMPDGSILIEIANSGRWIPTAHSSHDVPSLGIGLENVRQRLARTFPSRHQLSAGPSESGDGVLVRLVIHPNPSDSL